MTLIAAFFVGNVPVILGDVLTSTPLVQGERRFVSPSAGEIIISPKVDGASAPSGFCQKIVRISDNLCVAWSGTRVFARAVIEDVCAHFGDSEVTFDELNGFIQTLSYKEAREVSLVGICSGPAGSEIFGVRANHSVHPVAGPVYTAGTGSKIFGRCLDTLRLSKIQFNASNPALLPGGLGGSILTLEAITGLNLKQHFGGAFQTYGFEGRKFHRIPEATYVFWRLLHEDDSSLQFAMHPTVIKVCYKDDDLIIRQSTGIIAEEVSARTVAITSLVAVPPLLNRSNSSPIGIDDLPNLNSSYTFHGLLIERGGDKVALGYSERSGKSIAFHEEDGVIRAILSDTFEDKIAGIAKRFLGNS